MRQCVESRPWLRGCVVGVGLGRSVWVGAGVSLLAATVVWAGPEGEQVVRGSAEFSRQGSLTRITAADKTIIHYDRFNIGRNETVRFVQPSATSKVLNRVTGADPSRIDGTLQANGIVYFVNPAGVFFGNGALVDVGGIHAAAGNISNKDFLRGIDRFTGLTGSVVNEGRVQVATGGIASLVGQNVVNAGVITADRGVIAMVAGDSVVLGERGGVLSVRVDANPANSAGTGSTPAPGSVGVVNTGRVEARHGATRIVAGDMYALAVRNSGTVRAGDVKIEAQKPGGRDTTVQVGGVVDARNGVEGGRGGAIRVVGDKIIVLDAKLDASGRNGGGTVHVGGELQGGGDTPRAREAYVVNSSVRADAVKRGDGGEVVVFADEHLTFRAAASARGGEVSGDGGIVETSAKGTVNIIGARVEAQARAAGGKTGTWLMDPFDVSIEANPTAGGTFDGGDPDTFTPTATSVVDVADINNTLNMGTSVEILTGGVGGDPGTITLQAGATIDKTMGGDASLTLRAANDVVINGAIQSSSGALAVNLLANNGDNGNLDPDPALGSVFVTGTGSIDTNGGALTIEGVDVFLNGLATIATGTGNVFLRPTDAASTIGVGAGATGDFNVSAVELSTITSTGTVTVGRSGGTGAVDLNAVDVSAGGYSLTVEGGSIVTESVTVDTGRSIRLLANAGNVDENGTPTLSAVDGLVHIRADDVTFDGNVTIDAGTGTVELAPNTGRTVSVASGALDFSIGQDEVDNITSGRLEIGAADAGAMTVGALDASGNADTLVLRSGGDIELNGTVLMSDNSVLGLIGNNIDGSSLGIDAQIGGTGGVFVDATGSVNLDTDVSRIAINSGGPIDLEDNGSLSITTVGPVTGISAGSGGDIDITAGSISVDEAVSATGSGSVTLRAGDGDAGDIAVNAAVSSDTGDVRLWADNDVAIGGSGGVVSNSGNVEIAADFDLSNSGGAGTGGAITFDAGATVQTGGTITALADGDIDDLSDAGMNGTDPIFSAPLVNITSASGRIGGTTAIDTAATTIVASAPNGIDIVNTGDLTATLTSTDGVARLATAGTLITGADWSADAFEISAGDGFTAAHNIDADNGDSTFISSGGTVTVNGSRSITATGGDITIAALDLVLDGSLDSGTDEIFVRRSAAGTLGLGLATGDMAIDNNELERMTGARAVFGDMNETEINVNGVTGGAVANLGAVGINALGNEGTIAFIGTASSFRSLEANADNGIGVDVNLSVTDGDLSLNGDFDDAADGTDVVRFASGVVVSTSAVGGNIVLGATSGGILGDGSLTLNSANDIVLNSGIEVPGALTMNANGAITLQGAQAGQTLTLNADNGMTINGSLTNTGSATFINADADADGTGDFTLASGRTITTGGNDLTITAADVDLAGSIDAGTGTVSIRRATAGSIGLGAATGDLTADAGELSRITASTLRFGSSLTDQMNVEGVTAMSTAGIASLLELITDDISITGVLDTSMADLTITRANIGSIGVGNGTGDMVISGAELAFITTPELTIGGGQTTAINVSGVTAGQTMGIGAARLEAGEGMTFGGGSNTFRTLTAIARDGITVNSNLTASQGNLLLDGNADNDSDTNDRISIADGRTLSSGSVLTLSATAGGIQGAGDLTLNAAGDININNTLSTMGSLTVNADSDASGQGIVNIPSGVTVISNGNPISFTGSNFVLNGNVNSGAGSVAIRRSSRGIITVGNGAQGMVISGVELSRIIATGLTIGGTNAGTIVVNGVSAANSNTIVGTLRLEALADGGAVSFNTAASTFNALEVLANNVINVNVNVTTDTGPLRMNANANGTPDGRDAVRLAANIAAPGSQDVIFDSDVTVRAQTVTVTGNNVSFNGRVDSDSGLRDLAVATAGNGITAFNGDVGSVRRLRNLTTNTDGTTRIGGNISARNGAITFNDAVRLTADTRIRTDGGTGVFFNGAVDSQGNTNRVLTVIADPNAAANLNALPVISFTGNVGSTFALGGINLNFDPSAMVDGHVNIPRVATIIARPRNNNGQVLANPGNYSVTFNTTGAFNMGANEKLTALGNLTINAATARLGDLSTFGNMTVNAASIGLVAREAGLILSNTGTVTAPDQGLDLVSGGTIAFSVVPTVIGTGPAVSFATQSGSGDVNGTLSTFLFRAFGDLDLAQFNNGTTNIVTLDLRSSGPTNTNFADAIAGAIPRETRLNDVGQQVAIGSAQMEDLKNLGIVPRGPTPQELLDFLIGQAIYNDVPSRTSPRPDDYTTVVNRLPSERVQALLDDYDRVFNTDLTDGAGNPVINERTGRPQRISRTDEIRSTILGSVRRYRAENPDATGELDAFQFRSFVNASEEDAKTAAYLDELADFLDVLETIGLTPRELVTSKNILLKDVRPAGVGSVANFETIIRAGRRSPSASGDLISAR